MITTDYETELATAMAAADAEYSDKRILINLDSILLDADLQARAALDTKLIEEYADAIKSSVKFPSVVLFPADEKRYHLADGFQWFHAVRKAGSYRIDADSWTETSLVRCCSQSAPMQSTACAGPMPTNAAH
jgi:hypothetical protein